MATARRQVRSRPIRLLLIAMFAVPLVSLAGLWGFAADITLSSAISDHNYNSANHAISPAIQPLLVDLATERQESYLWLLNGRQAPSANLTAARRHTDQAVTAARAAYSSVRTLLSAQGQAGLSGLYAALGRFGKIRGGVDSGALTPVAAFESYSAIADYVLHYMKGAPQADVGPIYQATIGAMDGDYALEMAGREAALAGGALSTGHAMNGATRQLFASTAASRRLLIGDALALMNPTLRAAYNGALAKDATLSPLEDQISAGQGAARGPLPVKPAAWGAAVTGYLAAMQQAESQNIEQLSAMSAQHSNRLVTEAALAGGAGLAGLVISAALLLWLGRRVTGELTGLLGSVRAMAEERLPRVVDKLRRGEDVDVAAESPPPRTGTIREIARVADAFSAVQAAAVSAAVDQAKLRKGVSQVFLNLSMRNQSLLHRQLTMLDAMERRTHDPDALADLFRLDHLTTRMRRHAEGLIILAGVTPGRGWRDPVAVVDVLRAAIAEVEDYTRVDMVSESRDFVVGNAVNDLIHLIAELVENATAYSPPETKIEVRANRVGSGLVAEIEDRGLGLGDEDLAAINRRLAQPPEFDLADSDRLGLFIVSRLAARHGVRVALRHSPYGGVTAIVLVPVDAVVREGEERGPAAAMAGQAWGGRHGSIGAAHEPPQADGQDGATFGPTGRHRMPAQAGADAALWDAQDAAMPLPRAAARWQAGQAPGRPADLAPPGWGAAAAASRSAEPSQQGWFARPAAMPSAQAGDGHAVSGQAGMSRPGAAAGGSHLGMPIRVPQANIAAQLRSQDRRNEAPVAEPSERSPEATRDLLLAMQRGWRRGRTDDLDEPDDAQAAG